MMSTITSSFMSILIFTQCLHIAESRSSLVNHVSKGSLINNLVRKDNMIAMCSRIPSFLRKNTLLRNCYKIDRNMMQIAYNGSYLATRECQHQFRFRPWNCAQESLSRIANHAFQETAFLFAIHSAGLAYSLAYACSYGLIENCKCTGPAADRIYPQTHKEDQMKIVEDKLCSTESIKYGIEQSRKLLKNLKARDTRWLVDEHNKEAGRRALVGGDLKKNQLCRCHGVSGACAIQKCISRLPKIRDVSTFLLARYKAAVKVGVDNYGKKLIPSKTTFVGPTSEDLVFTEESPEFCDRDLEKGSLGTKSRLCIKKKDASDPTSCNVLCCNRGDRKIVRTIREPCNCTFTYCCNVTCKTCERNVTTHVCN